MAYQYDARGAMTRITWPDAFYAGYDRDLYGAVTAIRENGTTSGAGVLASYAYNNLGQPTGITRGNGAATTYGYAGQITGRTVSNPAYVYAPVTGSTAYTNDGLNRVNTVAGAAVTYDANQNVTAAVGDSFSYDAANRLTGTASTAYGYDPSNRLFSSSGAATRFQYAGVQLTGEYNASGVLTIRHIPGPGLDGGGGLLRRFRHDRPHLAAGRWDG